MLGERERRSCSSSFSDFSIFFFVEVSKKIKEVLPGETHGETFRKRNLSSFCFRRINVGINVQVYFEI